MKLIDTHTHLYLPEFDEDRAEMLERALEKGVTKCYLPNIDSSSISSLLSLEKNYPEQCIAMMGLHPCYVKENYLDELALVRQWLEKRSFAAIGEIGIDLYWDKTTLDIQTRAFKTQVEWALEYKLPIVIHSRDAFNECYDALLEIKKTSPLASELRGVFHCFGGTMEEAEKAIGLGFMLGIGGVISYKKAGLFELCASLSLEYLVLETDSPYLTPVPYRGKRNESSYLSIVAERLAEAKGMSVESIADITTENALKLFEKR